MKAVGLTANTKARVLNTILREINNTKVYLKKIGAIMVTNLTLLLFITDYATVSKMRWSRSRLVLYLFFRANIFLYVGLWGLKNIRD